MGIELKRLSQTAIILATTAAVLLEGMLPPAVAHVHVDGLGDHSSASHDESEHHGHSRTLRDEDPHGDGEWHVHFSLWGFDFPLPCAPPVDDESPDSETYVVRIVEEFVAPVDTSRIPSVFDGATTSCFGEVLELADVIHRGEIDPPTAVLSDAARLACSGVLLI